MVEGLMPLCTFRLHMLCIVRTWAPSCQQDTSSCSLLPRHFRAARSSRLDTAYTYHPKLPPVPPSTYLPHKRRSSPHQQLHPWLSTCPRHNSRMILPRWQQPHSSTCPLHSWRILLARSRFCTCPPHTQHTSHRLTRCSPRCSCSRCYRRFLPSCGCTRPWCAPKGAGGASGVSSEELHIYTCMSSMGCMRQQTSD
jgi:hypothetical protein